MKPQLTLQTPLELPYQEISNYLNKLWISEDADNSGANTFSLIVWQPAWLEQCLVQAELINGPITGQLSTEIIDVASIGSNSNSIESYVSSYYNNNGQGGFITFRYASDFSINACEYDIGDVSMDGNVNVTDVVSIINYILNNVDYNDCQLQIADFSQDGIINITDIIGIINIIIN